MWAARDEGHREADQTPIQILLVEDSSTDAAFVELALRQTRREFRVVRVQTASTMREAMERTTFDIVISDWSLPGFGGLEALALAQDAQPDVPLIIVSGTIGDETAIEAMRAGARDYVLKDKLARLAPAVERELRESEQRKAHRRADAAVAEQRLRLSAVVENSAEGIVLTTHDDECIYVSPAAARMFGVAPDAMVGKKLREFVLPNDVPYVAQVTSEARGAPGTIGEAIFRPVSEDGSLWIEAIMSDRLADPSVRAIVTNLRDMTQRRAAERALRISEARFARLAESGIIGIAVSDFAGNLLSVNDAYCAMVGYSREELLHRGGSADLTPVEWRAAERNALLVLQNTGVAPSWEKELLRKDGTRTPVLTGMATLDGAECIAFVIDLTERKRTEAALHRTEHQLRHAQKMEAVGRLAGGIAHDFNNLLSVILSYGELMLVEMDASDAMRGDLGEILDAARRAAALTRQLLMFSRREIVETKVIDVNDLLTNMGKMLQRLLGEDVELVTHYDADTGRVKADPGGLEQVIMNLAVNARDAMPKGGIVTIATHNVELDDEHAAAHAGIGAGRYVIVAVSDTGIGMDAAVQARIFEPFYTTKEVGKGTGLGLSTVFGIVQQSGGSVRVHSEIGKGAVFEVYLPRVDTALEMHSKPRSATVRGKETILLVEDEAALRTVLRSILARSGYRVLEAKNGAEALRLCDGHPEAIDLLLTDVVMPQMSGPELAHALADTRTRMKVLYMSGYTDDNVVRHGVLEASVGFLQKPITPETLTRKVRAVLDGAD
jgi:PAS domain S-box-containing protein